jgi:hypothetical protein
VSRREQKKKEIHSVKKRKGEIHFNQGSRFSATFFQLPVSAPTD